MASRDLNSVFVVGRLIRDPEFKMTSTGKELLKFGIASNRITGSGPDTKEEVSYFDVSLWGKYAAVMKEYLTKGKQVGIQGRLIQNRWQQDGQNRSKVEIVADNIQMFGSGEKPESQPKTETVEQGTFQTEKPKGPDPDTIPF